MSLLSPFSQRNVFHPILYISNLFSQELALLGGGGVFAYLKLVKNKPKTKGNDSLDDYDYGEEDSEEWETEDEESDEPDADGGSTEEDDEDSVK